jgi:hypothetical protein
MLGENSGCSVIAVSLIPRPVGGFEPDESQPFVSVEHPARHEAIAVIVFRERARLEAAAEH